MRICPIPPAIPEPISVTQSAGVGHTQPKGSVRSPAIEQVIEK